MKYLSLLFTYLMGKYNSFAKPQANFFTEAIILKIRKMVVLFSCLMIASIGLSLTFIKSLELIGSRLDQPKGIIMDGALSGTLVGFVLFGALFLYSFDKRRWIESETAPKISASAQHRTSSPLEEAVALLVTDFVKEREFKRETKKQEWSQQADYFDRSASRSYESASSAAGFGNSTQPPVM